MLTVIPFSGFYYSIHDEEIDLALEQSFSDRATGCEVNAGLVSRFYDKADFRQVHEKYARAYAESFAEEFSIALQFESLQSPRDYNFTTDRVFCTIDAAEVRRIHVATNSATLRQVAAEWFTSRSGFISHYSDDVAEWGDITAWDHNLVGCLIAAYVAQQKPDYGQWEEFELVSHLNENGYMENWLYECNPDSARLYKVHHYLQDRPRRRCGDVLHSLADENP